MEHDAIPEKPAGVDRRSLMGRLGAGAAGAAAVGAIAAGGLGLSERPAKAVPATNIDAEVLTFALNLEYLEAEFYLRAYFGYGLSTLSASNVTGAGTQGTVTGGSQVPFQNPAIRQYCQLLAVDELAHVQFIKGALGSAAVAEPNINLNTSFSMLAQAAGLIQAGQTFNPFADDISFLIGAFIFEDVGVTAYNGAATLITNPDYLQAAASILGTEAYHAGMIRTLLANIGAGQAANAVSALRAKLSNAQDDQGIIIPGNSYNAASTDANGLCFARTTSQVLNIVYGGGAAGTGGLFFPNGLNGTIR
ncbi:MAG: ferritin-like domain-containing protein [Acetobacteraceae bacterium]|nr:ferritin-like domain-containing protein [Acetobacteraceae bacterium]